jgi:hypothetical protein
MNEENKDNKGLDTKEAQKESAKTKGGAYPVTVPHLLYRDWRKLKVDGRSWFAKRKKELIAALLDPFNGDVPVTARILADITSTNLLVARRMEGFLQLAAIPPNTLRDYIALTNCNASNLIRLYQMAQNASEKPKIPGLDEYLKSLGAKVIEGENIGTT